MNTEIRSAFLKMQALRNAWREIWNDLEVADVGGIVGAVTAWLQVMAMASAAYGVD